MQKLDEKTRDKEKPRGKIEEFTRTTWKKTLLRPFAMLAVKNCRWTVHSKMCLWMFVFSSMLILLIIIIWKREHLCTFMRKLHKHKCTSKNFEGVSEGEVVFTFSHKTLISGWSKVIEGIKNHDANNTNSTTLFRFLQWCYEFFRISNWKHIINAHFVSPTVFHNCHWKKENTVLFLLF